MVLEIGKTLRNGPYTIERELGRGQYAISYLARKSNGERWVIKVLDPQLLISLSAEERSRKETLFLQETSKLARCSGTPHIARVELPFKEDDLICVPVEYLGSNSLAERPKPILAEQMALQYIQQIGEALTIVHRQGLVHRDIRPANIFLRIRDGQAEAVLTNFELAIDCDTELTRTRKLELTDGFSPLELYAKGQTIGFYTDVYSLAATLYDLLTGEAPASARDCKLEKQTLIPPQVKNPEISSPVSDAIVTGLELDPRKRPQTVAAWLATLHSTHPQSDRTLAFGPINWTKWGAIAAIIGVIVAVVGICVPFWLANRDVKPQPESQPKSSVQPEPNPDAREQ